MYATSYETPPSFPVGIGDDDLLLSAGDLNLLIANTGIIDQVSRLPRPAHCFASRRWEANDANPFFLGQWSGQMQTGLTTLTLVLQTTLAGGLSERVRVLINGIERLNVALSSGAQTENITISGLGFTHNQVLLVDVQVYSTIGASPGLGDGVNWGGYEVRDFYLSPASAIPLVAGTWPGAPVFTTTITAAHLSQTAVCQEWLMQRMDVVRRPLFQAIFYHQGTLVGPGDTVIHPLWSGSTVRSSLHNRLRVPILYRIEQTLNTSIRIRINGAVVDTIGPLTVGATAFAVREIDLSAYSVSTLLWVQVEEYISLYLDPAPNVPIPSNYSITGVETFAATPSADTMPTPFGILSSFTIETVRDRLNTITTALTNAYGRLDVDTWGRIRLFRRNYGYNDGQKKYYSTVFVPLSMRRIGAALWFHGKGATAGYGGAAVEVKPGDLYDYTYTFAPSIAAGDKLDTALIALDALEGLLASFPYILQGPGDQLLYAAEVLR